MKKYLIIGAIVLAVIIGIAVIANNNSNKANYEKEPISLSNVSYVQAQDGTKVNTSEELTKTKMLNGLKITNIQLTTNTNGKTTLLADVENTNSYATEKKYVTISILDKNGKELTKINGAIVALEAGAKTQLNVGVTADYVDAYDFVITEK